jgi:hypothetical protein
VTAENAGRAVALASLAGFVLWALWPKGQAAAAPVSCPSGDVTMNADGSCPDGYGPDPGSPGCCFQIGGPSPTPTGGGCVGCATPCVVS